jgi:hypothetical protein
MRKPIKAIMLAKMLVKAGDAGLPRKTLVTALLKANGKEWEPNRSGYGSVSFFTINKGGVCGIYWEAIGNGRYRITEHGKALAKNGIVPPNVAELREAAWVRHREIFAPIIAEKAKRRAIKRQQIAATITKKIEPPIPTPNQRGTITEGQAIRGGFTIDNHTNPRIAYKGERFAPTEIHDIAEIDGETLATLFSVRRDSIEDIRANGTDNEKAAVEILVGLATATKRKIFETSNIRNAIQDIFTW